MFNVITRSGQVIESFLDYPAAEAAARAYAYTHGITTFVIYED